jgi:hypothetical protein
LPPLAVAAYVRPSWQAEMDGGGARGGVGGLTTTGALTAGCVFVAFMAVKVFRVCLGL